MMALVSPYQYIWASIEGPLATDLNVSLSALGFVFTVYVIIMALVQFPAGWWRDRYGPRAVTLVAGILAGSGYYALALSTSLWHVYLAYGLGSLGVGMVYTVAVNTAIKWFPDRRGLATGIGTMAFAAGSAAFVPYVRWAVAESTLANALSNMGILIAIGILVGAIILKDPPDDWERIEASVREHTSEETEDDDGQTSTAPDGGIQTFRWREMVRTWQFWVMYFMFFAVSAAGLMITARVVLYAEHAGLTVTAVTVAAMILPLASGAGRLIVGGISDYFNRERVTALSFLTCGLATLAIVLFAGLESGIGYAVMVAIAVFFWSSQFSLFPSIVGDYYGAEYSSANYSIVYSGKMWGGVFGGGVVGWLVGLIGWDLTFLLGGALALAAGLLGFLLRPPR
ncbi:MFS transporter [Natrarchaeobius chitinivorans]|uniref:MFS transporter n=2 Tax=Natrarchaeobius chitinivorans TaxID=1679083 RepID=A0A3N6PE72_NATCH|nr:MFS transporter [Natrarchaeobius chitinivorans]